MGELALIERVRHGWGGRSGRDVRLGIGDDCALLKLRPGQELAITTDLFLEGRHFRRDWHSAASAGHRALARGLSDLAGMGARPVAAFLSLALPADALSGRAGPRWVEEFFTGLRELGQRFGIGLAGGDTSESPGPFVIADVVLAGSVPAGRALRRSGGRPGDLLYVTGALGGSAAELQALQSGRGRSGRRSQGQPGTHPQLFPEPRVKVGLELVRRRLASTAIDLSDGLSTDLAHLCAESKTGAEIDAGAIPIHALAARASSDTSLTLALHGGEDYELLFAAPPAVRVPKQVGGVPITRIGRLTRTRIIQLLEDGKTTPLTAEGWQHLT